MGHRRPLLDRDRGRKAGDRLHVRLLHLLQELAGVGGQALHVPALAFGVERVEGQAALARAGRAGDDHQLVPGQLAVDALEVVDPGAPDHDGFLSAGLHGVQTNRALYQMALCAGSLRPGRHVLCCYTSSQAGLPGDRGGRRAWGTRRRRPVQDRRASHALELYEKAVKALGKKDFERASGLLDELIEVHPEERDLLERARAFRTLCERSREKRRSRPKTFEDLLNYGVILHNKGDFEGAIKHLQQAAEIHPRNEHVLYCLAAAQARAGDSTSAIKALSRPSP